MKRLTLVSAAVMLLLILPPRLLPHSLLVDIGIGAIALLLGYAPAALLTRKSSPRANFALSTLAALLLILTAVRTSIRLNQINERVGLNDASSTGHAVLAVIGATLLATAVLTLIAGLRRLSWRQLAVALGTPLLVVGLVSARSGPASAGPKGAEFLAGATTATRVYIPLDPTASPIDQAALAVQKTDFTRAAVLIVIPTGSGWVNTRVVQTVEKLYAGDLTTVAVQYANSPSWQAFLRGGDGVRDSAAALVEAMRARIDRLPAGQRPALLAYGESLGAWGLLPVLREHAVDAALLTGVPGNPRIDLPGATVLNHPDDPVPHWGPKLSPVAFWRTTADAISSEHAPVGHGHRYGAETAPAWCALLTSERLTAQRPEPERPCRGD